MCLLGLSRLYSVEATDGFSVPMHYLNPSGVTGMSNTPTQGWENFTEPELKLIANHLFDRVMIARWTEI